MNPHSYTLDYDIHFAKDRNEYVKQIIESNDSEFSIYELE